jgi:hypothetical protein
MRPAPDDDRRSDHRSYGAAGRRSAGGRGHLGGE